MGIDGPTDGDIPRVTKSPTEMGPWWFSFIPNAEMSAAMGEGKIIFPMQPSYSLIQGGRIKVRPDLDVKTNDGKIVSITVNFVDANGNRIGNDVANVNQLMYLQVRNYTDAGRKSINYVSNNTLKFFGDMEHENLTYT